MNYIIRAYKADDLSDLMDCWEKATRIAHPFFTEEFIDQERDNIPNHYIPNTDNWVAEHEGTVIAFLTLIGNEVGALFVKPEFQSTGAGSALMDKARELHNVLEVEVFKENTIGRAFYKKYGFVLLEEKHHEPTDQPLLRLKLT